MGLGALGAGLWFAAAVSGTGKKKEPCICVQPFHFSFKPRILEDLNNKDVFDFNYEAKNGDELTIFLDDHSFAFEYQDGKFIVAPEDYSFTPRIEVMQGAVHIVKPKS